MSGAYPGFQRGGCLRSGPIRKVGAVHFRSDIRKVGEGGGGGQFASGPIRKVGGGGGAIRFLTSFLLAVICLRVGSLFQTTQALIMVVQFPFTYPEMAHT